MIPSTLSSIIVGVALDHDPLPVLVAARDLAARTGASLDLVHGFHVGERVLAAYRGRGISREEIYADQADRLRGELWNRISALWSLGPVGIHVLPGPAAPALARLAARDAGSLLIVGASHDASVHHPVLGSVARELVRIATTPVLVVRGSLAKTCRVLFTTDLSELSARVYARADELVDALAPRGGAERRSLLVASAPGGRPSVGALPLEEVARHELDRFLADRGAGEGVVRVGEPAAEIVREAASWGAQLIVVGTHSRQGAARPFMGSVAAAVLSRAPCSVLLLPAGALPAAADTAPPAPAGEATPAASG